LGQEIFLRLLLTKTTEIEEKMGAKVRKEQKQNIYCSYFVPFEGNKTHLAVEMN